MCTPITLLMIIIIYAFEIIFSFIFKNIYKNREKMLPTVSLIHSEHVYF